MFRFFPSLKKGLLIGIVILLGCDVSMLFAQPAASSANSAQNPQLQQLQSQVQQQIKALQNQSTGTVPAQGNATTSAAPTPGADIVGENAANQILSNQNNAVNAAGNTNPAGTTTTTTTTSTTSQVNSTQGQLQNQPSVLPPSPFPDVTATPQAPAVPPPTSAGQPNPVLGGQTANASVLPPPQNPVTNPAGPMASNVIPAPSSAEAQNALAQLSQQGINVNTGQGQLGQSTTSAAAQITNDDLNNAAFSTMVENTMPMSPEQIQKFRSVYMASQYAAASPVDTPPRPTATSVFVDLSPGATPPVIRLSQGFVSSLVFVDSTGAPWPIDSYDVGNPSAFNIQWDKTSNTLMVQSTVLYTYGNLAVKLRGLDTPVMLTLIPGQKAVDYRVDLRIQGLGPNAKPLPINTLPDSTSSDLLNVLDGVPPANSTALRVEGGDCEAWSSGGKMYVRTRLNVLSPGWLATLSSADGMHAYEMQPTPTLLVSQNGTVLQLKVEGF